VFLDLFFGLRDEGVPVAIQEWQAFLTALEQGLHGSSLLRFYHLGRACLVKSEAWFDAYDRVFARVFQGVEGTFGDEVTDRLLDWLREAKDLPQLTEEQLAELERLTSDELVRRPPRRNDVRLLLLMDVGGTMDPHVEPMSRLLTALHEERGLRSFEPYYFHNCVYEHVYTRARMFAADAVPTADLLRRLDERWKVALVGDAMMHAAELLQPYGNIDPRRHSKTPGVDWLRRILDHFDRSVWLNPEPETEWEWVQTTKIVRRLFPMFPLTVDGITAAVQALAGARA